MLEYRMPSLGADMESGFLREWRVKPGDEISRGDIIAEVETQKGIVEIEVFEEGIIGQLLIQQDEKVPVGTPMATILTEAEAMVRKESPVLEAVASGDDGAAPQRAAAEKAASAPHHIRASPLAKKIAAEKGLDIASLHGTGPEGAIIRKDVEEAIAAQVAPSEEKNTQPEEVGKGPAVYAEKPASPEEGLKASTVPSPSENIRMAVAAAMSKSNREIPHYYLETKIDMSLALDWLKETNKLRPAKERLLPAVLLIKAVAKALNEVPELIASWENGLQRKNNINIGYVVALRTGGIMVPTLHNADDKSLDELMASLNDLIPRARALRLRSSELADSTITLTNLGEGGVEVVYGLVYPPQVALVGFGGIREQPWAENGMLGIRPLLTATLAADHRATDGSTGSRFLSALKKHLLQPELL